MKRIAFLLVTVATVGGVVASTAPGSGSADEEAAPIYGVKVPAGYRDWPVISIAQVGAPLKDIRVKLGNDVAMKAFRDDTRPFPDGTITARLAYQQVTSEENDRVIRAAAEQRGLPTEQIEKLLAASILIRSGLSNRSEVIQHRRRHRLWPHRTAAHFTFNLHLARGRCLRTPEQAEQARTPRSHYG